MSIKQEDLVSLNQQLVTGQRVIRVGNSLIPVGVGGKYILKYPEVQQPNPTISISGTTITAQYTPLSGNTKDITIKNQTLDLTTIEENLTPQNIKSGVELFGIMGTHLGGDIQIDAGYITQNNFWKKTMFHSSQNPSGQVISAIYYVDFENLEQPIYIGQTEIPSSILDNAIVYIDFSKSSLQDQKNYVNFTIQGSIVIENDWATLNGSGYLQGNKVICGGNTTKTFVCVVELFQGNHSQIFQQGSRSGSYLYSLVYNRSTNYLGWHGWSQDYPSWQSCDPGKHVIIIEYNANASTLTPYIDGKKGNILNITNYCGSDYNIRLGCYNADDWYHSDSIKYRLFAVYDRILTLQQILQFNDALIEQV